MANASYRIVIEGSSYREKLSPHRKLLGEFPAVRTADKNAQNEENPERRPPEGHSVPSDHVEAEWG